MLFTAHSILNLTFKILPIFNILLIFSVVVGGFV